MNKKDCLRRRVRPADLPQAWTGSVSHSHLTPWVFLFSGIGMGMTVPISFAVFPSEDGSLEKKIKVWFRIPNQFQSDPPVPSDDSVKIEDRESITVYSRYGRFHHASINDYRRKFASHPSPHVVTNSLSWDENSLNNFQIYNTVLLAVVTWLYITSPELISLRAGSLYLLTTFTRFSHPPPLATTHVFYEFIFLSPHVSEIRVCAFLSDLFHLA